MEALHMVKRYLDSRSSLSEHQKAELAEINEILDWTQELRNMTLSRRKSMD